MKRMVDLKQVSDGRLYSSGDMVKADCRDCEGCSDCCRGMGNTILLDPMDVWRFRRDLHKDFGALLGKEAELGMADGMILPNLKMDARTDACPFLDHNGRCSVHDSRPGCAGSSSWRYYEGNGFRYFLQIHECSKEPRKNQNKKWLGIPDLKGPTRHIFSPGTISWKCAREGAETLDEEKRKTLALYVLRRFYELPYYAESEDAFYGEFAQRLEEAKEKLGLQGENS